MPGCLGRHPLKEAEVRKRADEFVARVDAFGAVGTRHWRGRFARIKTEKWVGGIIPLIRNGELQVQEGTPAHTVASTVSYWASTWQP